MTDVAETYARIRGTFLRTVQSIPTYTAGGLTFTYEQVGDGWRVICGGEVVDSGDSRPAHASA